MSDFERPKEQKGFIESASDLIQSPVLGEGLGEIRTAGDRAEEFHQAAPWFGSQAVGDEMAYLGQSAPVKVATDALAPIGLTSGLTHMYNDISEGHWGEAAHDGAGAATAGVGTAGAIGDAASWLGWKGAGEALAKGVGLKTSFLGPTAAVVGSGLAGWDIGNEFNAITKESGEYGKNGDGSNRSFSDKAGDDGWAAHEAVAHALGGDQYGAIANGFGHVAGAATTLGESALGTLEAAPVVLGHEAANLGRAAVSGVEKAGSAINHGATRLFDWLCDD